ncbi:MAG TPA: hypothetical protein VF593_13405 [Chthoniobacteraceae bacterium]|jgi:hypothetical protein
MEREMCRAQSRLTPEQKPPAGSVWHAEENEERSGVPFRNKREAVRVSFAPA